MGPGRGSDQHVLETDRRTTLFESGEEVSRVTSLVLAEGKDFHPRKDDLDFLRFEERLAALAANGPNRSGGFFDPQPGFRGWAVVLLAPGVDV